MTVARTPIPTMAGLRAFEAVARLRSFRKAAAELSVTTSAVSHQVRSLEEALRIRLFERGSHGVTVTSAGQRFLPEVQAAMDRLSLAIADLHELKPNAPLTISMLPTFAVRWMIPRVADLKMQASRDRGAARREHGGRRASRDRTWISPSATGRAELGRGFIANR